MINHDFGNDVQTRLFWACGCDGDKYVRPRSQTHCSHCNCWEANSRQAYCTEVLLSPNKFRDQRRTSSPAYATLAESTVSDKNGKPAKGTVNVSTLEWARIDGFWHLCSPHQVTYIPLTDGEFIDLVQAVDTAFNELGEELGNISAIIIDGQFTTFGLEEGTERMFKTFRDAYANVNDKREMVLWNSELGVIDQKL